jgi:predicted nuclease of restriction endonuclease-like (RecB) superfamily
MKRGELAKDKNYKETVDNIGKLLEEARKQAARSVNTILVKTYWQIGKWIVELEQGGKKRAEYGTELLKKLSKDLTKLHGKGFSLTNLDNMRKFYLSFPILHTLCGKLGWSHYRLIMRLDEPLAREFYIKETEVNNWSARELERQINSMLFERFALSKDKKGVLKLAKKGQVIEKAEDLVKDPYVLEFLDLEENPKYNESELEQKIIDNLKKFIMELGKGFMFVERQQRLTLDGDHFYIDLVFYNRILRCFVIIELKVGKLKHQDLGQLQMYVNYYDREIRKEDENRTIGILLCTHKKDTVVKYTLPEDNKQIFASKYRSCLPDKKLLQEEVKKVTEEKTK